MGRGGAGPGVKMGQGLEDCTRAFDRQHFSKNYQERAQDAYVPVWGKENVKTTMQMHNKYIWVG